MSCPHCHSNNIWDDNLTWGCDSCGWCSLGGLNGTSTPSSTPAYSSPQENQRSRDRQEAARHARVIREREESED